MPPNFGYTPPTVQEAAAAKPQKKGLPAHLIPKGAIHTGDGFVFKRLPDGAVQLYIMSTDTGAPKASTVLTPDEWRQVRDLVDPPAKPLFTDEQFLALQAENARLQAESPLAKAIAAKEAELAKADDLAKAPPASAAVDPTHLG